MTWNFNFCSPHLPNDPTINFHRKVQAGCLVAFLAICSIIHIYYKVWLNSQSEKDQVNSSQSNSDQAESKAKESDNNSESIRDEQKSVSIGGADFTGGEQNSSYVTFDRVGKKKKGKKDEEEPETDKLGVQKGVTVSELQIFFPIVFGHFAIASGMSIMYSPYAQQTIASIVYIIMFFILLLVNSKRQMTGIRIVWGIMIVILMFILSTAILELGQSNYNKVTSECFSVTYTSLY